LLNRDSFIQEAIDSKLTHFSELCLRLYHDQAEHNPVFNKFLQFINAKSTIDDIADIRFLPVSLFKQHQVINHNLPHQTIFTSSTTTSQTPSSHYVADVGYYEKSFITAFELFYGKADDYIFLCLLPGYLERSGSSLVYMAQKLIELSQHPLSGFYLYDFEALQKAIHQAKQEKRKLFLLGVTFALLDFAETFPTDLSGNIIMETGGMKGRKQEQTRLEIHNYLQQQFQVEQIHSEYGMTELLSQAYAQKNGAFVCPPWMKVVITDMNDPFTILTHGKTGLINVIDLANIDSCAFIQTQDLGRISADGSFEVLGRMDHSEVRGCNLMYL